jgi:ABC-type bacteriocin/lantibiotic exporter with double-glycine peptidase domain
LRSLSTLAFLILSTALGAQAPGAVWIDVPFVPQPHDGCGAAAILMVIEYWAHQQGTENPPVSDVAAIQQQLYSPQDHGISSGQMQRYFQQHGFRAFALNGQWNDLAEQLEKGRPLIAALRPQGQSELHYVVLDGVDSAHNLVTMNDPAQRKLLTEKRSSFEKEWSAAHNWILLAVPAPQPH